MPHIGKHVALVGNVRQAATTKRQYVVTIVGELDGESPRAIKERVFKATMQVAPSIPGSVKVIVGLSRSTSKKISTEAAGKLSAQRATTRQG